MIAHLYISHYSFQHNGKDSNDEVKKKLFNFKELLEKIQNYQDENILYLIDDQFLNTVILQKGTTVQDLLSYDIAVSLLSKDIYTLFLSLFKKCKKYDMLFEQVLDLLSKNDKDNCHGMIVLNKTDKIANSYQVLSTIDGWYRFRRYFLAEFPGDEMFFLDESKKYFPSVRIHESTQKDLKDVLKSHPKRIVEYLSILNDHLIDDISRHSSNLDTFLPWFKSKYNLDGASMEGEKDRKRFDFKFLNEKDEEFIAYCEPHLKMYKNDRGDDNQQCRIYFKKPSVCEKVVYVAYIGKHL